MFPPFFFEKYFENLLNLSEISHYANMVNDVFACFVDFSTNSDDHELKSLLINVLEEYSAFISGVPAS